MVKKLFCLFVTFFLLSNSVAMGEEKYFYSFDTSQINSETDEGYDRLSFIVSLQGIVNREGPTLYLYKANFWPLNRGERIDTENYWLRKFQQKGEWLSDYKEVRLNSFDELVQIFKDKIRGVVVWDARVDATENVAMTVGGVEGVPVAMYGGGVYRKLVDELRLPVLINLHELNFSDVSRNPEVNAKNFRSPKANAYLWLIEKYVKTGKVNRGILGYLEDAYSRHDGGDPANQIMTKDWLVMKGALIFDLSPVDEIPNDDRQQPAGTDKVVFEEILRGMRALSPDNSMIEVLGFSPWYDKYNNYRSNSRYSPVQIEEESVKLLSSYNAGLIAVDHVPGVNLSFHFHFPKSDLMKQNRPVNKEVELENKTYLLYYLGDYDAVSWQSFVLPTFWDDENRGKLPMSWSLGAYDGYYPDIVNYLYRNKSINDYFIAPFSGCLYVWADRLADLSKYAERCLLEYRRREYSFTGMTKGIDRSSWLINESFSRFSPGGVGIDANLNLGDLRSFPNYVYNDAPFIKAMSLSFDSDPVGRLLFKVGEGGEEGGLTVSPGRKPNFIILRLAAWSPTQVVDFDARIRNEASGYRFEAVDPRTFFGLAKAYIAGSKVGDKISVWNEDGYYRKTVLEDNLPEMVEAGKDYRVMVRVRNDGWDTWFGGKPEDGAYFLLKSLVKKGASHSWETFNSFNDGWSWLSGEVGPGETKNIIYTFKAPNEAGVYELAYDMMKHGKGGFRELGDLLQTKEIKVVASNKDGDFNGDGAVNLGDLVEWKKKYLEGKLTLKDLTEWKKEYLK